MIAKKSKKAISGQHRETHNPIKNIKRKKITTHLADRKRTRSLKNSAITKPFPAERTEERLQEAERFLNSVFTSIQDGISILDNDMNIIRVNKAIERWYPHAMPLVGKKCYEAYHGRKERCDACPAYQTINTGKGAYEAVPKMGAGEKIVGWLDLYSFPFIDTVTGKMRGVIEYSRDISARKRGEEERATLEDQLRQSQKMEAIGQLAGGVAHDFNNLLTVIKGYSQLSLMGRKEGEPLRENIQEIKKAADRAADLTRQLLAFSRRQVMEMKVMDLNDLLKNLGKMLHRVIGEDIELTTILDENLGRVKTDPGQIEQVIMNLVVNARDAMPKGGKLTIETANVDLDQAYARAHVAVKPGPYVMISASDTGVGMPPEIRDRVFEPFFTTKEKGKGTGLGLSTGYGIVKQSGGNIWGYSEPGKGTEFKIYLPRVDEPLE